MGLHVGPLGSEELLGALDGEVLGLIDHLAAAVVALRGISLGIFVGQTGTHGAHHLVADEVLAGDKLDAAALTQVLSVDDIKDLIVSLHCV